MKPFNSYRSGDINLELGVSDKSGELTYYYVPHYPACSGFSIDMIRDTGMDTGVQEYKIQTTTIQFIFENYLPAGREIDFLNIDIEGLDSAVLRTNNWSIYRPKVICVELQIRNRYRIYDNETINYLIEQGYHLFESTHIAQGVGNFIFIRLDCLFRMADFSTETESKFLKKTANKAALVSCIMPTYNRHEFVWKSIQYFNRQSYPDRELIIMDDSDRPYPFKIEGDRIRYYHLKRRFKIGYKRNMACQLAQGSIVIQWDDDDCFSSERISDQVSGLERGAHITAYTNHGIFDLSNWWIWQCDVDVQKYYSFPTPGGGHTSTLGYWKIIWESGVKYANSSLGEDYGFLKQCIAKNLHYGVLDNTHQVIILRHKNNTWINMWAHINRALMDKRFWSAAYPSNFISDFDLKFYQHLHERLNAGHA
ncbi:MAG: glycosyltransferase [Calditrichaeota bacterium]|nr:glycosyltransferase [Calditrichota bacterium]